jgi:hypothetical protein
VKVRQEIDSMTAEFIAKGGRINKIPPNVMADPPKKPLSSYGSRPI